MITATANLTHTPSRINERMPIDKKTNSYKRGVPQLTWVKARLKGSYEGTLRKLMLLAGIKDQFA